MQRQKQLVGNSFETSRIIYGCMKLGGTWDQTPLTSSQKQQAHNIVKLVLEQGITIFDHADIYCRGKSEQTFAEIFRETPQLREKIILQSKCGIRLGDETRPGIYDFSYQHIVQSVEQSLQRLGTDYLDILLLHRPDLLVEPEEVAKAFDLLQQSGKVRFFGVSNHTPMQIALLQKYLHQKLVVNQVQFSLLHCDFLDSGIAGSAPIESSGCAGTIEYCRLHEITLQAWSPLAGGRILAPEHSKLRDLLLHMAHEKQTSPEAIALSWILHHPAKIQVVIGSTNGQRILAACQSDCVNLTREEWYSLYIAARNQTLP